MDSLTALRRHLLLVASNPASIDRLRDMAGKSPFLLGLVGDRTPLLANLNVMENIALGAMYHHGMSLNACREKLGSAIAALDLEQSMDQRPELLTRPQRLKAQLLRCLGRGCGHVLLESPPRADCDVLHRALSRLDEDVFLWICCLSTERDVYTSLGYTQVELDAFA